MMKKVIINGVRSTDIVKVPVPEPKEDWALVKIVASPMCTEYKSWIEGTIIRSLGHEAAGEVVEVAQPCKVKPGDRVVLLSRFPCGKCNYCVSGNHVFCRNNYNYAQFSNTGENFATMAQYILKPSWLLKPIPDNVSYEIASLACCGLGPAFGASEEMKIGAFDDVLVTGCGPVGLGAVIVNKYRGARVIAAEPNEWRRKRALELGADAVIDTGEEGALEKIREFSEDGIGVSAAIDCSGNTKAEKLCIDATRPKGRVAFVGQGKGLTINVMSDLLLKGLTLHGIFNYNVNDYPKVMRIIKNYDIINLLISHVYPMSQVQTAMETLESQNCAKVILKPWEGEY
ncbi:MAG TPA: zinc-binding dehydrogenase [Clostridiales bacterium]|nr:zinc-binding dehydrogenase [Clostridiales bacterium]